MVVGGVPINNVTVMVENGLTAVLLFMAAKSFRKVVESDTNQLRYVFQACGIHTLTSENMDYLTGGGRGVRAEIV